MLNFKGKKMSFEIASVFSENNMVLNQSANQSLTPENFLEKNSAIERGAEDVEPASSLKTLKTQSMSFPTFRSFLSPETMQTLLRMYAR